MAKKRIKAAKHDIVSDRIRILYDDGTQGELVSNMPTALVSTSMLIGLTLEQAKSYLGIKN